MFTLMRRIEHLNVIDGPEWTNSTPIRNSVNELLFQCNGLMIASRPFETHYIDRGQPTNDDQ